MYQRTRAGLAGATDPVPVPMVQFRSVGCGPVAQLGARFHGMEEVKGSNPFRSTKTFQPGRRRNTHWPPIMLTVADAQASARESSLRVLLCGAFLATLLVFSVLSAVGSPFDFQSD